MTNWINISPEEYYHLSVAAQKRYAHVWQSEWSSDKSTNTKFIETEPCLQSRQYSKRLKRFFINTHCKDIIDLQQHAA